MEFTMRWRKTGKTLQRRIRVSIGKTPTEKVLSLPEEGAL
jgi:hypothetical protein